MKEGLSQSIDLQNMRVGPLFSGKKEQIDTISWQESLTSMNGWM